MLKPMMFATIVLIALYSKAAHASPSGIRPVDWRNFHYSLGPDSLHSGSDGQIVLHNGKSWGITPDDFEVSRLAPVRYADFRGDGRTEAAGEVVTPVAARRAEEDNFYVFEWREGRPHQIFFRMYESGATMQVEGRSLVILQPDWSPPDPIHWTQIVLRWRGTEFRTISSRRIPRPRWSSQLTDPQSDNSL